LKELKFWRTEDSSVGIEKGKLRVSLSYSLAPLKQQIMIDKSWGPLSLIGVEPPALLLPLLNRFTNIFVVTNLHAFILFQFTITSLSN